MGRLVAMARVTRRALSTGVLEFWSRLDTVTATRCDAPSHPARVAGLPRSPRHEAWRRLFGPVTFDALPVHELRSRILRPRGLEPGPQASSS